MDYYKRGDCMSEFNEYLNENYNKNENMNLIEYSLKEIPDALVKYYEDIKKDKAEEIKEDDN